MGVEDVSLEHLHGVLEGREMLEMPEMCILQRSESDFVLFLALIYSFAVCARVMVF